MHVTIPGSRRPRPRPALPVVAAACVAVVATWTAVSARSIAYTIDVHDGRRIAYEVPFRVDHPGVVAIEADWEGGRILAFRIDRGVEPTLRRSGPSPQRIEVKVDGSGALPADWVLRISALPASGGGTGRVRLRLPDAPEVVAAREKAALPPPPPPPRPSPWMEPLPVPIGVSADRRDVHDTIEAFRRAVVDEERWTVGYDPCRWREGVLRYLVEQWETLASGGPPPTIATRRYFRNVAAVADDVESFRRSDDPLVAGPPPPDDSKRFLWLKAREPRVRPLERKLDRLLVQIEDGFVPELERETWPQRFISCLTACQRHFDDQAVHGAEHASNRRLAATQWEPILAAARAFGALSMVSASDERAERTP